MIISDRSSANTTVVYRGERIRSVPFLCACPHKEDFRLKPVAFLFPARFAGFSEVIFMYVYP